MHKAVPLGILFAAIAVVLGAFGAHALRARLEPAQLQVFETGVRYQMYHALALVLLGLSAEKIQVSWGQVTMWCFFTGILFFSGSLYLLSVKSLLGSGEMKFLGPVTPVGGLCFIAGWLAFLIAFLKK